MQGAILQTAGGRLRGMGMLHARVLCSQTFTQSHLLAVIPDITTVPHPPGPSHQPAAFSAGSWHPFAAASQFPDAANG